MPSAANEILTTSHSDRWAEILERIDRFDFCHLPSYNRLAEMCGHGEARMFVHQESDYVLAFPVLFRNIQLEFSVDSEQHWRDVTSVYGYAGPISSQRQVPPEVRNRFTNFVKDYLQEERVVSALSRMHPLIEQTPTLEGIGEVDPVGWTLSLDLTRPEEEQIASYRRNHRQDIARLKAMGVTCEQVGVERVDEFVEIYHENMDRVGAARRYYFSTSYFEHLISDMPEVSHLFMCEHEGRAVAAGIFTLCRGFVQWYLSGSRTDFEGPPPTKIMFEVARRWAIREGAHTLHLGGGVGGAKDSLYHFKRGFTKREHTYSIWKHIANREIYDELFRIMCDCVGQTPSDGFFPIYRHPIFRDANLLESKLDATCS